MRTPPWGSILAAVIGLAVLAGCAREGQMESRIVETASPEMARTPAESLLESVKAASDKGLLMDRSFHLDDARISDTFTAGKVVRNATLSKDLVYQVVDFPGLAPFRDDIGRSYSRAIIFVKAELDVEKAKRYFISLEIPFDVPDFPFSIVDPIFGRWRSALDRRVSERMWTNPHPNDDTVVQYQWRTRASLATMYVTVRKSGAIRSVDLIEEAL